MPVDPAGKPDPEFPGLPPEVVAAWREAPSDVVVEVLDGELFTLPRPRPRHAFGATRLIGRLRGFHDPGEGDPGGWTLLVEPELHLGPRPDIVVPDLAGWRAGRLPAEVFADDAPAGIAIAPDWVCELLSDRTEAIDRGRKMRIYRREGVGYVWLLDPRARMLEVWRLVNRRWVEVDTFEGSTVVRAEPFDAVALDLAALWTP